MKDNKKETIVLSGENGNSIEFEIMAEVNYDGYNYLILRPIKKYDDLDEDMAMVFRVEVTPDGDNYILESDDEIIDIVGEIYNSELD